MLDVFSTHALISFHRYLCLPSYQNNISGNLSLDLKCVCLITGFDFLKTLGRKRITDFKKYGNSLNSSIKHQDCFPFITKNTMKLFSSPHSKTSLIKTNESVFDSEDSSSFFIRKWFSEPSLRSRNL